MDSSATPCFGAHAEAFPPFTRAFHLSPSIETLANSAQSFRRAKNTSLEKHSIVRHIDFSTNLPDSTSSYYQKFTQSPQRPYTFNRCSLTHSHNGDMHPWDTTTHTKTRLHTARDASVQTGTEGGSHPLKRSASAPNLSLHSIKTENRKMTTTVSEASLLPGRRSETLPGVRQATTSSCGRGSMIDYLQALRTRRPLHERMAALGVSPPKGKHWWSYSNAHVQPKPLWCSLTRVSPYSGLIDPLNCRAFSRGFVVLPLSAEMAATIGSPAIVT